MLACPRCAGFVPDHAGACPNCDAAPSRWARLGRALVGFAGMVTLAACYGAPPPIDRCYDADGDGWLPGCYDEEGACDPEDVYCDCDDLDPTINPGQLDPSDGIDRDCDAKDGQRPEGPLTPPGEPTWADAALGFPEPDAAPSAALGTGPTP
jgi:hypothetical protein